VQPQGKPLLQMIFYTPPTGYLSTIKPIPVKTGDITMAISRSLAFQPVECAKNGFIEV